MEKMHHTKFQPFEGRKLGCVETKCNNVEQEEMQWNLLPYEKYGILMWKSFLPLKIYVIVSFFFSRSSMDLTTGNVSVYIKQDWVSHRKWPVSPIYISFVY